MLIDIKIQLQLYLQIFISKQQDFQQFNYGVYVSRGPIAGGLWARNSLNNFDSFILMLGIIQESFKFGYSYDIKC